ncbi:hypothetical protein LMG9449_0359 [Lactococcus lactis subsp. lactis]|uniref:Uncharacterized protein n=1 Tax=Lactococcus lactis subsp. lactis TaxID=1360 RepID=A0A0V8EMN0_LACLL|nr:hypothetical protein LLCRE1631_01008 [Lactococcus lactis subsp. lactis CNCM I-1631]KST81379.1 hypothetical protein ATCC19435_1741 [Lactococcus lactis subsp. lactis]KST83895.1 hypothetical protein LK337_1392 [Lactococcus lactis subsp. lactis]KST87592.1 hypothetical protein LKF24_2602 [Lactococcus lactis subsp. lactis]KST88437.1 hypothetical protein LKF67_2312 [Lactococcus lactis subsp. lactis]
MRISGYFNKVFHRKVEKSKKMLINHVFILFSMGEKGKIIK